MTLANALSGEHLERSNSASTQEALSPALSENQLPINSNPPSTDHGTEEPNQNFDVSQLNLMCTGRCFVNVDLFFRLYAGTLIKFNSNQQQQLL